MIPRGFIQDLLARVDVVDVIGRYVALKKAGQNYVGLCPFHGEKTPSFTVSPSKQFFHCFGCGAHGSAIGFLMDHRGLAYAEAIRELAQQVGMRVPEDSTPDREGAMRVRGLTEALQRASDYYRRKLRDAPAAIEYLKRRGLTGHTAARFALGYAPDAWQPLREAFDTYEDPRLVEAGLVIVGDEGKRYDRFRGRVMFPIRNRRGAVIGFGARVLDGGEPKYLNSPETPVFHKGQELYGLFEAQQAIRRRRRVIVCEGYMDVIQLAQAGFEECVAALGTAITAQHVGVLLRLTDQVIFAFDGDAAGRKAARRALEATLPVIADTKRASFVLLPEGEDPDSLVRSGGAAAFEDHLARAMPLSRWFVASLADGKDLEQAEDRAALVAQAKPLLASMPPAALRMQLVRELAEAARTPSADLESLFGLRPWRRLPDARRPANPPRHSAEVDDLKARILQRLIAYPDLAREFNAQIAAEFAGAQQPIDRQIAEVWRTATLVGSTSPGALVEALADSEFADTYREISASDLLLEGDASAAREDLRAGFATLELRRVENELAELVRGPLTPESRERIRELSERRVRLKETPRRAGSI
ncbi:MAG: DNA primase [Burkholderiaceae bacterium]